MNKEQQQLNFPDLDITDLLKIIPNRFLLSSVVSKRARQLLEGEKPKVEIVPNEAFNPVGVAMKELLEGHFTIDSMKTADDEIELIEKLDKSLDEKLEKEEAAKSKDKDKKSKSKSLSTF